MKLVSICRMVSLNLHNDMRRYQNSVQKLPNEYSGAFSVQGDKGTWCIMFLGLQRHLKHDSMESSVCSVLTG